MSTFCSIFSSTVPSSKQYICMSRYSLVGLTQLTRIQIILLFISPTPYIKNIRVIRLLTSASISSRNGGNCPNCPTTLNLKRSWYKHMHKQMAFLATAHSILLLAKFTMCKTLSPHFWRIFLSALSVDRMQCSGHFMHQKTIVTINNKHFLHCKHRNWPQTI